ncbi:hypothetical protein ASPZODRAFT_77660, partial [Penicilliopsis zonata CBS 506.65]
ENDSSYEEGLSTYTQSLTSSVLKNEFKHGRRYHSYQSGAYMFPNDEREQDRLDMTHYIYFMTFNDRLFLAPIDLRDKRVLDIGTGTGIWAVQLGDDHPEAEQIIGNDLSAIQPSWTPPNVKFIIDDVELDWVEEQPYDFIHCRYMSGSIKDWTRLVQQCYNHLKPGGWIEFHDGDYHYYSEDGTFTEENYLHIMMSHLIDICTKIGRPLDFTPKIKGVVEKQGFTNVSEQIFPVPAGGWPKDKRMKDIGRLCAVNVIEGVDAFTAAPFSEVLGWSRDEIEVLNAGVRQDCKRRDLHAMWNM